MSSDIVLLLGPTAVGKTDVACAMADLIPTAGLFDGVHLISVDSAMVYRGLDIGTAKPSASELEAYPHALIDIRDPSQPYNTADFVQDADEQIRHAHSRGLLPVLVGGTMLYAKRFSEGIAPLPASRPDIRQALEARLAREGGDALHTELADRDPAAAQLIHPNNPQRLLRALEVIEITGQPMSVQWSQQSDWHARLGGTLHTVALVPEDRASLYTRIAQRFDLMLEAGFLQEVKNLHGRNDLHADLPAIRAVGYRQAWAHLDGELDTEQFRHDALVATRHLAKRQLTWLRQWPDLISPTVAEPWREPEAVAAKLVRQLFSR